jgi:protein TonB
LIFDKVYAEHKLRKIRIAVFIFTAALHGIIFFFVSVEYQNQTVVEREETARFSLVNISAEEEGPPELSKSAAVKTVTPPPSIQVPEQKDPVENFENFIEIEEAPAEESIAVGHEKNFIEDPPAEQYASDGNNENPDGENRSKTDAAKNAALVREYVRRNFDYISRRVRSKLIYPAQARRTGLDGVVEVLFTLNMDGSVSGVSVKKSAGVEMLDAAAIAAIKSASPFRAPPVSTKLLIPVAFSLRQ